MEEKKNNIEYVLKKHVKEVAERVTPILGKIFYAEDICVEIQENGTIAISNKYGVGVSYPPMTDTWVILVEILLDFDNSKDVIAKFFDVVAFPVVMSLPYADSEYIDGIVDAFEGLTKNKSFTTASSDPDIVILSRTLFENALNTKDNE